MTGPPGSSLRVLYAFIPPFVVFVWGGTRGLPRNGPFHTMIIAFGSIPPFRRGWLSDFEAFGFPTGTDPKVRLSRPHMYIE